MKHVFTIICLLFSVGLLAQPKSDDAMVQDSAVGSGLFRVAYAAQIPVGDYADRFGFTNHIGASAGYRTKTAAEVGSNMTASQRPLLA